MVLIVDASGITVDELSCLDTRMASSGGEIGDSAVLNRPNSQHPIPDEISNRDYCDDAEDESQDNPTELALPRGRNAVTLLWAPAHTAAQLGSIGVGPASGSTRISRRPGARIRP